MGKNIIIVGGHGNVALRLARLLSPTHTVTSIIRNPDHSQDIKDTGAAPHVLSLEDAPSSDFAALFQSKNADLVYFSAGGGGKGGPERTKAVDYEGALKVFDAVEALSNKPRLILFSAIDVRSVNKIPDYYNEEDIKGSEGTRKAIGPYYHWKTEADINLMKRAAFNWTILRPGLLTNEPGTGKGDIGRTHLNRSISRDDVAKTLALLADREDAAGLAIDLVGGEAPLHEGLETAIKEKKTWRLDELVD